MSRPSRVRQPLDRGVQKLRICGKVMFLGCTVVSTVTRAKSFGSNGIYRTVYQNAAVTYTIRMSPSGKISLLLLQPAFP